MTVFFKKKKPKNYFFIGFQGGSTKEDLSSGLLLYPKEFTAKYELLELLGKVYKVRVSVIFNLFNRACRDSSRKSWKKAAGKSGLPKFMILERRNFSVW